ncbi:hypothetical protein Avbf_17207 [Armadillidium vulgare]|nr:hypothetical protein Avbf_17207 [Armadillidium vulgare]
MIKDIIEDISNNDSGGRSGRKKRSYSTKEANNDSISRVLSLIENGMINDFYQEAPNSILTFLGTALEESDNQIPSSCVALSFCSFSARMTYKFGTIGQIVSKLVTNVASRLLTTPDGRLFGITQEASKYGPIT